MPYDGAMNDTEAATAPESNNETAEDRPGYSPYKLGIGVSLVLVLASIFLFLSFFSIWANRQILSSDQWTKTSTEVLQRPAVQSALANYMVDQLFAQVNVEQQLQNELPSNLDALAGPATGALHSLALSGAKQALAQPIVQQAWKAANKTTHQQLIATLEGGNNTVSTANGEITVNTRAILNNISKQVGLNKNIGDKLPQSAGSLVIYKSQGLGTAQTVYKAFKDLLWVFALLTILLYVAAIWLAKGRRRRAVIWMGVSFVTIGILVLLTRSLGRTPAVNALAQTSAVVPAATDIYDIGTDLLNRMAGSLVWTGAFVIFAGVLAGPYRWTIAFRRFLAPYLRDYLPGAVVVAIILYLIVIWVVPSNGFQTSTGLLLNSLLAIAGFVALVLITRREFPDAEEADFGAAGEWITSQWRSATGYVQDKTRNIEMPTFGSGDDKTTEISKVAVDDAPNKVDELERLTRLHKDGALTDAEFEAAKKQLLG